MELRRKIFWPVILLFLLCCVAACNRPDATEKDGHEPVRQAVTMAANHLADQVTKNGQFVYQNNLNPKVRVAPGYNILRHAGTIYAMAMYDAAWPDKRVRAAMVKAGRYLQKEAVSPVPGKKNMSAVWSLPEVNKTGAPVQAKLGGTGLGLVALLSIEAVSPGFTPMARLGDLGRFILYMQKPEGNFYSKYIPGSGGPDDSWTSLYYPGEAAFGLVMLYEKDPDPAWLDGAVRALTFLADSRRGAVSVPEDHWALIATERLLALSEPAAVPEGTKDLLTSHAIQICTRMVDRYENSRKPGRKFASALSTTQVACTLEGLQAALALLPPDHLLRPRMRTVIEEGITFLIDAQVADGPHRGAIPRMAGGSGAPLTGAGGPKATEIRIDYTQHALSALVRYAQREVAGTQ
ncbi:hypothetical protein [Desulfosudis oleivorans]|uniref:Uncharacterized protein n=1 Tax=Desulfosudis oleivorans (strain DSM 6200 / JCM 39069 / Hxd3) TaxID=96561 RepID=A8ZTN0_DESOH|nr:hypothetical protein [Desulfosudis oleivorans]ABW66294.1 hypothetical protein Dole_0484 [Desulfosudis oleivorans Hxd3]